LQAIVCLPFAPGCAPRDLLYGFARGWCLSSPCIRKFTSVESGEAFFKGCLSETMSMSWVIFILFEQ
jgi:hypothetical protein